MGGGGTTSDVLWRWRRVTPDDGMLNGAWQSRLAEHEIAHAHAVPMTSVRASYVAARDVLRSLVAEWSGATPTGVQLLRTPLGAPYLPEHRSAGCSLSHAGDVVMAALRPLGPVGIDVELLTRPLADFGALLRIACTDAERIAIEARPPAEQRQRFLTAWTGKEAVLKALGVGLSVDPRNVAIEEVDEAGHTAVARRLMPDQRLSDLTADTWHLHRIREIVDHVATIALPAYEAPRHG